MLAHVSWSGEVAFEVPDDVGNIDSRLTIPFGDLAESHRSRLPARQARRSHEQCQSDAYDRRAAASPRRARGDGSPGVEDTAHRSARNRRSARSEREGVGADRGPRSRRLL